VSFGEESRCLGDVAIAVADLGPDSSVEHGRIRIVREVLEAREWSVAVTKAQLCMYAMVNG